LHVPAPVSDFFTGRGAILRVGLLLGFEIVGVIQAGVVGAVIVTVVAVLALTAELWAETGRLGAEKTDLERDRGELTNRVAQLSVVANERDELAQKVDELQSEVAEEIPSVERLLESLGGHVALIELVEKHSELAQTGAVSWPVVRVDITEEGTVRVKANGTPDADRVAGELVVLLEAESDRQLAVGPVSSADKTLIVGVFEPDDVGDDLLSRLHAEQKIDPAGLALTLAGEAVHPYRQMNSDALAQLKGSLEKSRELLGEEMTDGREG
jgi:hypothetical protein